MDLSSVFTDVDNDDAGHRDRSGIQQQPRPGDGVRIKWRPDPGFRAQRPRHRHHRGAGEVQRPERDGRVRRDGRAGERSSGGHGGLICHLREYSGRDRPERYGLGRRRSDLYLRRSRPRRPGGRSAGIDLHAGRRLQRSRFVHVFRQRRQRRFQRGHRECDHEAGRLDRVLVGLRKGDDPGGHRRVRGRRFREGPAGDLRGKNRFPWQGDHGGIDTGLQLHHHRRRRLRKRSDHGIGRDCRGRSSRFHHPKRLCGLRRRNENRGIDALRFRTAV